MLSRQSQSPVEETLNSTDLTDKIGFTRYAEILHGRLAMVGFVFLLAIAILTKHGIISSGINL